MPIGGHFVSEHGQFCMSIRKGMPPLIKTLPFQQLAKEHRQGTAVEKEVKQSMMKGNIVSAIGIILKVLIPLFFSHHLCNRC